MKGLTPVSVKNGQALKNSFHLQNQIDQNNTEGNMPIGLPYRQNNSMNMRNTGNHTRMSSLPTNIKGSIGNGSGMQRDVGNGMPLNIAANDITFAGDYKTKYMKFGQ